MDFKILYPIILLHLKIVLENDDIAHVFVNILHIALC